MDTNFQIKDNRIKINNKLKKIEEGFFKIFDSNPIGMIISNLETSKFEYVNDFFLKKFVYTKAEIIGKTPLQFNLIEPESYEKVLALLKKQGFANDIEVLVLKKNGQSFCTKASVQVITLNNMELAITSFQDLSDLEKNETLLKSEEPSQKLNQELEQKVKEGTAELELLNKKLSDYKYALDKSCLVAITDQKGIIREVNDKFCEISKYTREELIGKDHRIINSKHHSKEYIQNLWKTIANGNVWIGKMKNRAKDGTKYWVDTTIVPILDINGKPYQYLAIRSDVTSCVLNTESLIVSEEKSRMAEKRLEEKVKERTLELTDSLSREKELNEMKSRFVSFAAHEFRTPLSSILSSSYLIEKYNNSEQIEHRSKHINRIAESVTNLTDILNNFLTHAELEQGIIKIENTIFNLTDFITKVIAETDGMLYEKKQKVIYQHSGETSIELSDKILRNILLNLLSNASKYSYTENEIILTSTILNNKVSISIQDYGIGIPEEDQKMLFDQFYRTSNVQHIQGTGLGLSIVKKYLELINGKIEFTSKLGEGSTFTIEFSQSK